MSDILPVEIRYADGSFQGTFDVPYNGRIDPEILEDVFCQWNAGSQRECKEFHHAHCRSLSTGDFVKIGEAWYRCEDCGWKFVSQVFITNWFDELNRRVSASPEPTIIARWTASTNMGFDLDAGELILS